MAVVNQYKFVGIDDSTSGAALSPLDRDWETLYLIFLTQRLNL